MIIRQHKLHSKDKKRRKALERANRKAKPVLLAEPKLVIKVSPEVREERKSFAQKLNLQLPKSEVWFQALYQEHQDINDFFNKPLGNYIPDVANYRFKYVIEVDGSIHNLESVKARDSKKDRYYSDNGYKVIRIKSYDEEGFKRLVFILNIIRKKIIKRNAPQFTQEQITNYMLHGCSSLPNQGNHAVGKDAGKA